MAEKCCGIRLPKLLAGTSLADKDNVDRRKWYLVRQNNTPHAQPTLVYLSSLNGECYTLTEDGGIYTLGSKSDYVIVCEVSVDVNVTLKGIK